MEKTSWHFRGVQLEGEAWAEIPSMRIGGVTSMHLFSFVEMMEDTELLSPNAFIYLF